MGWIFIFIPETRKWFDDLGFIYPARSLMPKPEPFCNSGWLSEMFLQSPAELRNGGGSRPTWCSHWTFTLHVNFCRCESRQAAIGKGNGLGSSRSMGGNVSQCVLSFPIRIRDTQLSSVQVCLTTPRISYNFGYLISGKFSGLFSSVQNVDEKE